MRLLPISVVGAAVSAMALGGGLTGCAAPASASASSGGVLGVTCSNLPIHSSTPYSDEVYVRVRVRNATPNAASYAIDVKMIPSHPGPNDAASTTVTVSGSVPAGASNRLERKVLTSGPVKSCAATAVKVTS